jgi:broad specificity phosphatase PhoE
MTIMSDILYNKKVLLMRHAESDFSFPKKWNTLGWGNDLAPLSTLGEKQAIDSIKKIKDWNPEICLVSPTTRTMSTALIIIRHLDILCKVEFDLHEWVPDRSFNWNELSQVKLNQDDMRNNNGEWPDGIQKCWEPLSHVKKRVSNAISKYSQFNRILVICHCGVIWSITGEEEVANCETREVSFKDLI